MKKLKKYYCIGFLLLSLLIGGSLLLIQSNSSQLDKLSKHEKEDTHDLSRVRDMIKSHKSSIVRLYSAKPDYKTRNFSSKKGKPAIQRKQGRFFGTGWFIEKDLIVTNYHVTTLMPDIKIELPTGQKVTGSILVENQKYDLAFVDPDLPDDFSADALELNTKQLDHYQEIINFGYPYKLNYFSFGATLRKTTWGMRGRRMTVGTHPVWSAKLTTGPGASGSPVFDKQGRVVGIVEAGRRGFDNTLFIPARYIEKLYNQLTEKGLKKEINRLKKKLKKQEKETDRRIERLEKIISKLKKKLD